MDFEIVTEVICSTPVSPGIRTCSSIGTVLSELEMASAVCKSRNCIRNAKVLSHRRSMRPSFETAKIRCYSNPSSYQGTSFRMPSRGVAMQKESGFESKGLVLLLVCGVYAVFLFVAARLFSYIASRLTASVKSVMWRVETTDGSLTKLAQDHNNNNNNNNSAIKLKIMHQRPRTISHG